MHIIASKIVVLAKREGGGQPNANVKRAITIFSKKICWLVKFLVTIIGKILVLNTSVSEIELVIENRKKMSITNQILNYIVPLFKKIK